MKILFLSGSNGNDLIESIDKKIIDFKIVKNFIELKRNASLLEKNLVVIDESFVQGVTLNSDVNDFLLEGYSVCSILIGSELSSDVLMKAVNKFNVSHIIDLNRDELNFFKLVESKNDILFKEYELCSKIKEVEKKNKELEFIVSQSLLTDF